MASTVVACESTTIATTPTTSPPSTHGSRRPIRSTVRSEKAPHTGFRTVDTAAPRPVTSASTVSLCAASTASACCASSTWIGPKNPAHTAMLTRESQSTHARPTGSSRLRQRRAGRGRGHRRLAAITAAYQSNDRFGIRSCVS